MNRSAAESYQAAVLPMALYPGCGVLRRAVRGNAVSFPSRIPALLKTPSKDMQWRVVLLYFVLGWTSVEIAARFGVPKHRVRQILKDWSVRAFALGCMEIVNRDAFLAYCMTNAERGVTNDTGLFLAAPHRAPAAIQRSQVAPEEKGVSYAVA